MVVGAIAAVVVVVGLLVLVIVVLVGRTAFRFAHERSPTMGKAHPSIAALRPSGAAATQTVREAQGCSYLTWRHRVRSMHMYTCMNLRMYVCVYMCMYVCISTNIIMHIIFVYIYIYIHTYTHTCVDHDLCENCRVAQ